MANKHLTAKIFTTPLSTAFPHPTTKITKKSRRSLARFKVI
jgi:hypothetical protein